LFVAIGGGELARDADAEAIEILSTRSLTGVPGALSDVTLGLRDETLLPDTAAGVTDCTVGVELLVAPALGNGGGVSLLGVPVIRKVLGCVTVRLMGEPVATAAGVPGHEEADEVKEGARFLASDSGFAGAEDVALKGTSLSCRGVALEMSSFPGCGRLLVGFSFPFGSDISLSSGSDLTVSTEALATVDDSTLSGAAGLTSPSL
jgi:hypothetical protein